MRGRFPWYFFEKADYDAAWTGGILTVDTNVMLDLYRYNKSTREALLAALEDFKGRFWISDQTAKEFVKNRHSVIADMINDFSEAKEPVGDVEKTVRTAFDAIRTCRVIPKELSETFKEEVLISCKAIREGIDKERTEIPDYAQNDEVVRRLEAALDGCIGEPPAEIADDLEEAKRRKTEKVPPGYLDENKEGLGFAGDYFMWRQILSHSKEKGTPMLLVTSETKEDWWEKKSGKTLNPRLELLQEAFRETGQKILIYHTDQFLRMHQERAGRVSDETVLEEIRVYSLAREPAVSVSHEADSAGMSSNSGTLRIVTARPVRNFTGTGRFKPNLSGSPDVTVKLVKRPDDAPDVQVRATGTTSHFNVHVHSNEQGKMLPVGEYLAEYAASCGAPIEDAVCEDAAD